MRSLHCNANSASELGSSLSNKSYPLLRSVLVHRPNSLAPLGGCPPVFRNRAIASLRVAGCKVNVSMNFIAVLLVYEVGGKRLSLYPYENYRELDLACPKRFLIALAKTTASYSK